MVIEREQPQAPSPRCAREIVVGKQTAPARSATPQDRELKQMLDRT